MKRFLVILAVVLTAHYASAQLTRATISGRVTDPSGAVVANAQVVATDVNTHVQTTATSNSAGYYNLPFLMPGTYDLNVERAGFKGYALKGLVLVTDQHITENISLTLGRVSQEVVVSGSTPLINTTNSNTGQVLTPEQLQNLPLNGGAPLGFAHMMFGAVAKGKHSMSETRPFDNSTADDFSLGGGASSSNELLLDGVPNMQNSSRLAGFSPLMDAVSAVHVEEFDANASTGDTSGGTVDIVTKSGTNHFHGSAIERYAGSRPLEALPYFQPKGSSVQSTHYNQFGGTIGGPVWIPHVYNGRNRFFFFYSYEGYRGNSPSTVITSVPTAAERSGDFSGLLSASSSNQLYDPFTATPNGSNIQRSPIPGNVFSNAGLSVSPIAKAYLAMVPMPNYTGPSTTADGENNYFASDPTTNDYNSNQARFDYVFGPSNKLDVELHRSDYAEVSQDYFHTPLSGSVSDLVLWGGQANDIENFSPTLSLETRLGFSRSETVSGPASAGISPSTVGFPGYLAANATQLALPPMYFGDSAGVATLSGLPGSEDYFDTIQLFTDLTKNLKRQTIEMGIDFRTNKNSSFSGSDGDGWFTFSNATGDLVGESNTAPPQQFGSSIAEFELGVPSSGGYTVNTKFQYNSWYFAGFAQDDVHVTPNFTANAGIRFVSETPVNESNNRQVVGWEPNIENALTAPAIAAYTAQPNPMLPVADFQPTGGVIYATPGHRSAYDNPELYVSPRLGFAYSPGFAHGTMAIRGGFAIYINPFNDYNVGAQYGYAQSTNMIVTTNNNANIVGTLSDPFPQNFNPIEQPFGNTFGINTNLGSSISYYSKLKVPYVQKWTLDVQKQFARNWLVEVAYMGAHAVHDSYNENLSNVPLLPYLSHTQGPNAAVTAELSASTPNPFYKLTIPGQVSGLTKSKTTSVASLLKAYPEYSEVEERLIPGASSNFNALLFKARKRLSHGLQFIFNYEWSRNLGANSQLNDGGPLWYGETTSDFPQHASVMAIYGLPFGRGKAFFNQSRLADEVIGGWQLSGVYQYLSGTPDSWGNVNYTGNFKGFDNHPHKTNGPSFNTAGFATASADQPNSYNYRTFPEYLLRSDPTKNFDFSISKNFILEHVIIQPKIDAFNAFNRPQFKNPNLNPKSKSFGFITSQLNTGRQLQGGIHIMF